ncbi:DDE-type integrase/transposase/recombinase [Candidatus Saccharibacteria bacterium]|nr:DDE-type integrase/transposase/recombinase [Candidatus Saccharibacteria bacterium]
MSYQTNPNLPKVRDEAVKMVRTGCSTREVARHFGFSQSAVVKWCQKVHPEVRQFRVIPTETSRPHHHPNELDKAIVDRILELRDSTQRGAEFIHVLLRREGVVVSLSSVKRTLSRHGLTRYSKWKKWHQSTPRPVPETSGVIVEADTIYVGRKYGGELHIYTLIDLHSRWVYATPAQRISAAGGADSALIGHHVAPFQFQTIQTDHGPEFSTWFTKKLLEKQIMHRYTRGRKPNYSAHIERFNRTIQDECISRLPHNL